MFYNREFIPKDEHLLDIPVTSFKKREVDLLQFVSNVDLVDLNRLQGFSREVEEMLKKYTVMPGERAEQIARSVEQKIGYLQMFRQGKRFGKRKNTGKVMKWGQLNEKGTL